MWDKKKGHPEKLMKRVLSVYCGFRESDACPFSCKFSLKS